MKIAVAAETRDGEARVALVPELVAKLTALGYDVAVVMTFKDRASLEAYGPHPVHQRVLKEVLLPRAERYRVYDFVPALPGSP